MDKEERLKLKEKALKLLQKIQRIEENVAMI
jgi:hypothetical protein